MRDVVELNELYPLMKEVIESGGEFRFYPRGISMEPLLHQGDDSVVLAAVDCINEGDVLFYRRESGQFVLHRLIEKRGKTLTMSGDNQLAMEYGVKPSQVLAKMVAYYKGDTYHSINEEEYIAYTKKQLKRYPFYRRSKTIHSILKFAKKLLKKN